MQHAFTTNYPKRTSVIFTDVRVCPPLIGTDEDIDKKITENSKLYKAIWDTGATNSVITKKVADELGIEPTGMVNMRHANGVTTSPTFFVSIILPNGVGFGPLRVTQVTSIADEVDGSPQLLIGMDIINSGDFAFTNFKDKSCLSFRLPSQEKLDFVPKAKMQNIIEAKKNRRNNFRGGNRKKRK